MSRRIAAAFFAGACIAALRATASAEWRPPDLRPASGSAAAVLAAYAKAPADASAPGAQRRERWTYANGERRFAVRVAVRGADFRATLALGAARYAAGRSQGVRWRADANDVTHATLSDDQGDAADRLPQSVFPFALADCELAGESNRFGPAWVVADRAPRDKPHWFYVDKASGAIAHEITREGARAVVTSFDRFALRDGVRRPLHWRVSDGNAENDLDVTVDAVEPGPVGETDVAIPQTPRAFAPASPPPSGVLTLPAHFRGRTVFVDAGIDGHSEEFVLDTGTASITLNRALAERHGWRPVLEHVTVPRMTVGALALADVSTLAIPLDVGNWRIGGILGYDFFIGNVVHVDYAHERVEVLTPQAAEPVFRDPRNFVAPAYFDEGVPLVHAAFGPASGDRFLLDTGSPRLFVLAPFARRYAKQIDATWPPAAFGTRTVLEADYLEGSIVVAARRAAAFKLGPYVFEHLTVGVEQPNSRRDAIDVPADAIVGTDQMARFDWWFDYDGGRIALRRNAAS
ncbi:MAG TPA: hypothetical protein VFF00_04865 [Candidatus Elarobacter sp.]|nr:hypothetical protein [Candidatus Elarobacter sp.]